MIFFKIQTQEKDNILEGSFELKLKHSLENFSYFQNHVFYYLSINESEMSTEFESQ